LAISGVLVGRLTGAISLLTAVCRSSDPGWLRIQNVWFGEPVPSKPPALASSSVPIPPELAAGMRPVDPGGRLPDAVLSEDGRWLALSARQRAVHVWDVWTGHTHRTLPLRGSPWGFLFSPDGSRLVVDGGTTLYVHHTTTFELLAKWRVRNADEIFGSDLAWSPDGRLLARTNGSSTVRVYEVATGREVMAVGVKPGSLVSVAFAPDGLTLATGTDRGPVRVWDVD
jgi:WD40 repeat protein